MRTTGLTALTAALIGITAGINAAAAADVMVTSSMQRCTSDSQCVLVSLDCDDSCDRAPVNESSLPTLDRSFFQRCGRPIMPHNECSVQKDLEAACVNGRCTIGTAYKQAGSAADYKSGAYPLPESAVPYEGPSDYDTVDDRSGTFTAYDLPKEVVKQNVMGEYEKSR